MEPGHQPADESSGNPTDDSGAPDGAEIDPFAVLKTIVALDCIRIRVPEVWPSAWDEKAGMWCCCQDLEDPALDTGTFWIDVDVLDLGPGAPVPGSAGAGRALQAMAQKMGQQKRMSGAARGDVVTLRDMSGGKVISYWRAFESQKGKFAEYRWHSLTLRQGGPVVAHYSLVLTAETADRPAWRRLVETLDGEVRAADVGLPGSCRQPGPTS
jgi:hypothetical protein